MTVVKLTKTDMVKNVIYAVCRCRQKEGSFKTESSMSMCFVSLPGRISLCSTSLFTQISRQKKMFTSSLGTGADRPDDQSGVHLLGVHLAAKKQKLTVRTVRF